MNRSRRKEILWDLVDCMFEKVAYWDEFNLSGGLTWEEEEYLLKVVSSFAKQRGITNHISIQ